MPPRSRKPPEVNPSQGTLIHEATDTSFVVAETYPGDPKEKLLGHSDKPVVVYGEPGSYVDVIDRATHLDIALAAFGKRNQRIGFDLASNVSQYDSPIYARYRSRTHSVREGTYKNTVVLMEEAKQNFWQATGYSALRGTRLVSNRAIDARGRKMWREFSSEYGNPSNRMHRNEYRAALKKSVRLARQIIKRAAA